MHIYELEARTCWTIASRCAFILNEATHRVRMALSTARPASSNSTVMSTSSSRPCSTPSEQSALTSPDLPSPPPSKSALEPLELSEAVTLALALALAFQLGPVLGVDVIELTESNFDKVRVCTARVQRPVPSPTLPVVRSSMETRTSWSCLRHKIAGIAE